MRVFFSDTHLGKGNGSDDFHRDDLLLALLDYAGRMAEEIIILGDLYELWQSDLEDIFWAHPMVIKALGAHSGKIRYVFGNHDYLPFSRIVPERYTLENKVVAMHGHQFDKFNNFSNPLFGLKWPIGKYITVLIGELERWGNPDIDDWLDNMKRKFGDFIVEAAKIQNRKFNKNNPNQLLQVVKGLKSVNLAPISIFGHTHESELSVINENGKNRIYANCGSWVDDSYPTFIELTDKWIRLCDGNDLDVLEEVKLSEVL